jgi:dipeptidyl aminopeptidase/acylaminoacyl peptidase
MSKQVVRHFGGSTRSRCGSVVLCLAGLLSCPDVGATPPKNPSQGRSAVDTRLLEPIPLEEGLKIDLPLPMPQVSPDGSLVAFEIISRWRAPSSAYPFTATGVGVPFAGTRLFVMDLASGRVEPLLSGAAAGVSIWSPSWSPDGESLAFLSDRDGMARLWIWNKRTRTARKVSDTVVLEYVRQLLDWQVIQWMHDSSAVLVPLLPEGATMGGPSYDFRPRLDVAGQDAEQKSTVRVYSGDEGTRFGGEGSFRFRPYFADLGIIDVATGKVRTLVPRRYVARHDVSPDGKLVAFHDFEGLQIVDVASGVSRVRERIAPAILPTVHQRWAPDGTYVVYRSFMPPAVLQRAAVDGTPSAPLVKTAGASLPIWTKSGDTYLQAGNRILTIDEKGAERVVATRPDLTWTSWVTDGQRSTTLFQKGLERKVWAWGKRSEQLYEELYEIDLTSGESRLVSSGPMTKHERSTFVARLTSRPIAYLYEDAHHPSSVYVATSDGRAARKAIELNPVFDRYVLGETRVVEWLSDDGERLSGALLLPAGYRPGTRYPTVLWVYGGDRNMAASRDEFGLVDAVEHNMQLLATRGYAVFVPDSKLSPGTPMLDIAKSILPGASKLVELGIADPDRLGVMGHSYGMYTALALVVQTSRFRAAVAFGGISNLLSYYGSGLADRDETIMITEQWQRGMKGSPWEVRDAFIENSPFFYFNRITTPVLLVHGDQDLVSVAQSDQVYLSLRRLGKEVVYLRYAGTLHNFSGLPNLLNYWEHVVEWFEKHLATTKDTQ